MKLSKNAIQLLEARYLLKNTEGKIVESPEELFWRVAKYVASTENEDREKWENKFYALLANLHFLPNSPTLMNAGLSHGQLSACFVLIGHLLDFLTALSKVLILCDTDNSHLRLG